MMSSRSGKEVCWQCSIRFARRYQSTLPRTAHHLIQAQSPSDSTRYRERPSVPVTNGPQDHVYDNGFEVENSPRTRRVPKIMVGLQRTVQEAHCNQGYIPERTRCRSLSWHHQLAYRRHQPGIHAEQVIPEDRGGPKTPAIIQAQNLSSNMQNDAAQRIIKQELRRRMQAHDLRNFITPDSTARSIRMFSTTTSFRAGTVKERSWAEQISSLPQSSLKAHLPIRKKLKLFQQALDRTTEANKSALGIAFSMLRDVPGFANSDDAEKQDMSEIDEDVASETHRGSLLREGSLLEVQRGARSVFGLIIAVFPPTLRNTVEQYQVLLSDGAWMHIISRGYEDRHFISSDFLQPGEYAALKKYLPTKPLPEEMIGIRNAGASSIPTGDSASVVKKLQAFQSTADEVYRSNANKIDHAFESLAKPDVRVYLSLEEITRKILKKSETSSVSQEELYAVFKACSADTSQKYILEDIGSQEARGFAILSEADVAMIEKVQAWVREHCERRAKLSKTFDMEEPQDVIEKFAAEIRPIILQSRKNREILVSTYIGPSKKQPVGPLPDGRTYEIVPGSSITPETSLILRFLQFWSVEMCLQLRTRAFSVPVSVILKAVNLYDDRMGSKSSMDVWDALTLLKESGVVSPWHFPAEIGAPWRVAEVQEGSSTKYWSMESEAESVFDGTTKDRMKHVRQDWGGMQVFCIDPSNTRLVDDGISLETCAEPDTYWIHCHIANPSAFIHHRSKLAKELRNRVATIYLPDGSKGMFPDPQVANRFSLQSGRPVLTISTKLNLEGVILDRKLQNGFINNVVHLTPELVNDTLANADKVRVVQKQYVVGQIPPTISPHNMEESLSKENIHTLRTIKRLLDAWLRQNDAAWNRKWMVTFHQNEPEIFVHGSKFEAPSLDNFRHFVGDPAILVRPTKFDFTPRIEFSLPQDRDIDLVSGCMSLSNHTAANWCGQRGITGIFVGSTCTANSDLDEFAVRRRGCKNETIADHFRNMDEIAALQFSASRIESTRMMRHETLAMDGYMAVTSPLRRSQDLLNHWQIEAALLEEAKLGRQLAEFDAVRWPFSEAQLLQTTLQHRLQRHYVRIRTRMSTSMWLNQFLLRGVAYKQCQDLPKILTMYIVREDLAGPYGLISELSISRRVLSTNTDKPKIGEIWKVRLAVERILGAGMEYETVERVG